LLGNETIFSCVVFSCMVNSCYPWYPKGLVQNRQRNFCLEMELFSLVLCFHAW
jgi:hypothetical protein